MSLAKDVTKAIESAFNDPRLKAFSPLDSKEGDSFARYYRGSEASECEVAVYRDKWWTKSGGKVIVDLFCLPGEVQRALGGSNQSWLNPSYDQPMVYFSYRTSQHSEDTVREVESSDDAKKLGLWLTEFLVDVAVPWFGNFESNESITAYLEQEALHFLLAKWHVHLGKREEALNAFQTYLLKYPRQIEDDLSEMEAIGLVSESDRKTLLKASIQQQTEYERVVRRWCESRGK